jgi:hypothetical protein
MNSILSSSEEMNSDQDWSGDGRVFRIFSPFQSADAHSDFLRNLKRTVQILRQGPEPLKFDTGGFHKTLKPFMSRRIREFGLILHVVSSSLKAKVAFDSNRSLVIFGLSTNVRSPPASEASPLSNFLPCRIPATLRIEIANVVSEAE